MNPINLLIVGTSFYSLIHFEKNKLINIFIILFIFIENSILTFGIYKNIILLIVCFIIVYNFKKKISLTIFVLILAWSLLGQVLKVDFRNLYEEKNNSVFSKVWHPIKDVQNKEKFNLDTRPVILRLTEPIVSLMRIIEFEKIEKKKSKRIQLV